MNEYEHLITLEKSVRTKTTSGGYSESWIPFKEVYAHVQPLSGTTYIIAQQNQSKINYKVFMDFDEEVNSTLRVNYDNKILKIKAPIDQGGLGEVLVLMCEGSDIK
ncbi:phage head closure protein [Priestia megaterium]|uniref:phage head closure protein n=1 Tax=Priestia megaterium TaxID=1404 RepID=UPI003CC6A23D